MKDLGKVILEHATNNVRTEYSNYSKAEREEAINKAFFEALGMPNGYTNKKEFRKAMRKNEVALHEIIEEIIDGIGHELNAQDIVAERFMEERNLDLGDTNEFYAEGGDELELVEYSGAHWDVERQRLDRFETFTVKPKSYIISVYEYVDRVASGRADWSYLVSKVAEAIANKKRSLVYETLKAAFNFTTPNQTPFAYSGAYNAQEILDTIAHVEAGNGVKPILIGSKVALSRLAERSTHLNHSDSLANERNSKGFVSTWMGYECIELTDALDYSKRNQNNANSQLQLPHNEIYIVSSTEKFIKVVNEGAEVSRERTGEQMADMSQELTVRVRFGVAAIYNSYLGKITLT